MGFTLWLLAGFLGFILTRFIESWRRAWYVELGTATGSSLAGGLVATAMDFGGWAVPDARAFAFSGLASLLAVGLVRLRARRMNSPG